MSNKPAEFTPNYVDTQYVSGFKVWCQKVLPLVYDDSLSYYETLCNVVSFLNKVIESTNASTENVSNLHKAYTQLQAYVNSYFQSLSVQNEINNKLDQMANSGALSKLVKPFIDAMKTDGTIQNMVNPLVQPAVNTKVQAMVSDGSFGNIVNQKLTPLVKPAVDTKVQAMVDDGSFGNIVNQKLTPLVQPAVDTKVQAMVSDGSLGNIVNQKVTPLVQPAVDTKVQAMVDDGSLGNIVNQKVAPLVQPAVNTKVQAMVDDGSFGNIVKKDVDNKIIALINDGSIANVIKPLLPAEMRKFVDDGTFNNLLKDIYGQSLKPEFVSNTGEMTDKAKLYVLTSTGNIWTWNGSAWVDTGVSFGGNPLAIFKYRGHIDDRQPVDATHLHDLSKVQNGWYSLFMSAKPTTKINGLPYHLLGSKTNTHGLYLAFSSTTTTVDAYVSEVIITPWFICTRNYRELTDVTASWNSNGGIARFASSIVDIQNKTPGGYKDLNDATVFGVGSVELYADGTEKVLNLPDELSAKGATFGGFIEFWGYSPKTGGGYYVLQRLYSQKYNQPFFERRGVKADDGSITWHKWYKFAPYEGKEPSTNNNLTSDYPVDNYGDGYRTITNTVDSTHKFNITGLPISTSTFQGVLDVKGNEQTLRNGFTTWRKQKTEQKWIADTLRPTIISIGEYVSSQILADKITITVKPSTFRLVFNDTLHYILNFSTFDVFMDLNKQCGNIYFDLGSKIFTTYPGGNRLLVGAAAWSAKDRVLIALKIGGCTYKT